MADGLGAGPLVAIGQSLGQGWGQVADLALAFGLSSLIGLERELRQKSAGLRTHTIVGVASALLMLVSKYGFTDVVGGAVRLDPSRVAAQIVSGIGFIGGGLIFVRRDAVRGLTTAAVVWLTMAVGMAAGAGLPVLALLVTAAHFVVVFGYTPLAAALPRSKYASSQLVMTYEDGRSVLRHALALCTRRGFSVSQLSTDRSPERAAERAGRSRDDVPEGGPAPADMGRDRRLVTVVLEVHGQASVTDLAVALADIDGMVSVSAGDANTTSE